MSRALTYDHLRGKKQPYRQTISVVLDQELAAEYEDAKRARDVIEIRAKARPDDVDVAAEFLATEQRLAEITDRLLDTEAIADFTFRGIGRHAFEKLVLAHPATADQRAKAKAGGVTDTLQWNIDTFPAAVIAACCVEPALTFEQALDLWNDDNWNASELDELLAAALSVCSGRRNIDLGKGSRRTPSSEPKSPTA